MKIKPNGNRLLVEMIKEPRMTSGGVELPENYVSTGPMKARVLERNVNPESMIKTGDIIVIGRHAMFIDRMVYNGKECAILPEDQVIAVIEE